MEVGVVTVSVTKDVIRIQNPPNLGPCPLLKLQLVEVRILAWRGAMTITTQGCVRKEDVVQIRPHNNSLTVRSALPEGAASQIAVLVIYKTWSDWCHVGSRPETWHQSMRILGCFGHTVSQK